MFIYLFNNYLEEHTAVCLDIYSFIIYSLIYLFYHYSFLLIPKYFHIYLVEHFTLCLDIHLFSYSLLYSCIIFILIFILFRICYVKFCKIRNLWYLFLN